MTRITESGLPAAPDAASFESYGQHEALKDNFLIRGFFRKRGYDNLDRISPDQYRRDTAFSSRTNYRAPLSAPSLFQAGSNGEDGLSAAGTLRAHHRNGVP